MRKLTNVSWDGVGTLISLFFAGDSSAFFPTTIDSKLKLMIMSLKSKKKNFRIFFSVIPDGKNFVSNGACVAIFIHHVTRNFHFFVAPRVQLF